MRLIIAGGRNFPPNLADRLVAAAMNRLGIKPDVVVSGAARGIDQAGERWAEANGVAVERYPADWDAHGRAAGPIRNRLMAENADAAVVIWDGGSRGSKNMIAEAKKRGLRVVEVVVTSDRAVYMEHAV